MSDFRNVRVYKRIGRSLRWLVLVGAVAPSTSVFAIPDFLSAWQNRYPTSTSDSISCQLCHQNITGGSPWNAYGWDIRAVYRSNGFDIDDALRTVEIENHDNDPIGADAYDEILANFQPGWRPGAVNSVFSANGTETINQALEPAIGQNEYDFPAKLEDPIQPAIPTGTIDLGLVQVTDGLNAPVRAVTAPGINGSTFVVEQTGQIYRVELASGRKTLFHSVQQDLVPVNPSGDERGLLGLAFHPNYQTNGLFYTYQSEPARETETPDFSTPSTRLNHRSMIVEYRASDASCNSSIRKTRNLMIINQPQGNHNGGDLAFGPDGHLYISLGDGGSGNDQGPGHGVLGNGRNNGNVLGSILRIAPLGNNANNGKYGVPADNPFVANGDTGVDEIFAYGFRNPFRLSFDATTGELYAGDVGQREIEEIDKVVKGGNYGWNWKEGSRFFYNPISGSYVSDVAPPNLPNNLVDPVGEYDHDEGVSVIGGYVYRGSEINELTGKFVFGEFLKPLLYLDLTSSQISKFQMVDTLSGFITGFGQDANNELYVVTNNVTNPSGLDGKLMRLVDPAVNHSFPDDTGETPVCTEQPEFCVPIIGKQKGVAVICL